MVYNIPRLKQHNIRHINILSALPLQLIFWNCSFTFFVISRILIVLQTQLYRITGFIPIIIKNSREKWQQTEQAGKYESYSSYRIFEIGKEDLIGFVPNLIVLMDYQVSFKSIRNDVD